MIKLKLVSYEKFDPSERRGTVDDSRYWLNETVTLTRPTFWGICGIVSLLPVGCREREFRRFSRGITRGLATEEIPDGFDSLAGIAVHMSRDIGREKFLSLSEKLFSYLEWLRGRLFRVPDGRDFDPQPRINFNNSLIDLVEELRQSCASGASYDHLDSTAMWSFIKYVESMRRADQFLDGDFSAWYTNSVLAAVYTSFLKRCCRNRPGKRISIRESDVLLSIRILNRWKRTLGGNIPAEWVEYLEAICRRFRSSRRFSGRTINRLLSHYRETCSKFRVRDYSHPHSIGQISTKYIKSKSSQRAPNLKQFSIDLEDSAANRDLVIKLYGPNHGLAVYWNERCHLFHLDIPSHIRGYYPLINVANSAPIYALLFRHLLKICIYQAPHQKLCEIELKEEYGQDIYETTVDPSYTFDFALSPDGCKLWCCERNQIVCYDTLTGNIQSKLRYFSPKVCGQLDDSNNLAHITHDAVLNVLYVRKGGQDQWCAVDYDGRILYRFSCRGRKILVANGKPLVSSPDQFGKRGDHFYLTKDGIHRVRHGCSIRSMAFEHGVIRVYENEVWALSARNELVCRVDVPHAEHYTYCYTYEGITIVGADRVIDILLS